MKVLRDQDNFDNLGNHPLIWCKNRSSSQSLWTKWAEVVSKSILTTSGTSLNWWALRGLFCVYPRNFFFWAPCMMCTTTYRTLHWVTTSMFQRSFDHVEIGVWISRNAHANVAIISDWSALELRPVQMSRSRYNTWILRVTTTVYLWTLANATIIVKLDHLETIWPCMLVVLVTRRSGIQCLHCVCWLSLQSLINNSHEGLQPSLSSPASV